MSADLSAYARSFPASAPASAHWTERTVTQGHADYCAQYGHATWTEDGVTIPRCPRCGVSMDAPAQAAALSAEVDAYVSPADIATPAPCTHWECALMGSECVETGAPAMIPPRTPRTYTARRIVARLYEYVDEDGGPADVCDDETFNVDATPHRVEDETLRFDTMAELVAAVRRDGVTFQATGADWATDPDGSQIIDYATAERETVSWHFDTLSPAMLARVVIPAVDAL